MEPCNCIEYGALRSLWHLVIRWQNRGICSHLTGIASGHLLTLRTLQFCPLVQCKFSKIYTCCDYWGPLAWNRLQGGAQQVKLRNGQVSWATVNSDLTYEGAISGFWQFLHVDCWIDDQQDSGEVRRIRTPHSDQLFHDFIWVVTC